MRLGILGQTLHDEIDRVLECLLFLGAVMRLEALETTLPLLCVGEAEQVLEATFHERIAFHVEEEIARIGLRQTREALTYNGSKQLVMICSGVALDDLQLRLLAKPGQRLLMHFRD